MYWTLQGRSQTMWSNATASCCTNGHSIKARLEVLFLWRKTGELQTMRIQFNGAGSCTARKWGFSSSSERTSSFQVDNVRPVAGSSSILYIVKCGALRWCSNQACTSCA